LNKLVPNDEPRKKVEIGVVNLIACDILFIVEGVSGDNKDAVSFDM
jgi:hypothetical protein